MIRLHDSELLLGCSVRFNFFAVDSRENRDLSKILERVNDLRRSVS